MRDVHSALEFEYLTGASIGDDAEDILLGTIAASDLPLSGELAEREISQRRHARAARRLQAADLGLPRDRATDDRCRTIERGAAAIRDFSVVQITPRPRP